MSKKLTVRIYSGKNLIKSDVISKSDSFIKLTFQNQKFQTKIIKNTLEPVWNESFEFDVSHDEKFELVLECLDEDLLNNDIHGNATIDISDCKNKRSWIRLSKGLSLNGQVDVEIIWENSSSSPLEENTNNILSPLSHSDELSSVQNVTPFQTSKSNQKTPSQKRNRSNDDMEECNSKRAASADHSTRRKNKNEKKGSVNQEDKFESTIKKDNEHVEWNIQHNQRSPGPTYDVSQASRFVGPRLSTPIFGKEKRLPVYKTVGPGPRYIPNNDFRSDYRSSPIMHVGNGERPQHFILPQPFQGKYHTLPPPTICSTTPSTQPITFSRNRRMVMKLKRTEIVGPGRYNPPPTVGMIKTAKNEGTWMNATRDSGSWMYQ